MFAYRRHYAASMRSQRGVAAIMAAVLMFSMVAFMALVTDTGRLYFEKRSQQKNTDLAALETALRYCRNQSLDDSALDIAAENVMARNNYDGDFQDGGDSTIDATLIDANTVQVIVTRNTAPSLFQRMMNLDQDSIILTTTARAKACEPTAQLTIRSNGAVSVDTSNSPLLNPILGGLLGATINAPIATYQGLISTNINLLSYFDALASRIGLEIGDYDSVLAAEVSVEDLLEAAAVALDNDGHSRLDIDTFLSEADDMSLISDDDGSTIEIDTPSLTLGEFLSVQPNIDEAALDTNLQALQVIQGVVQLANSKSVASADIGVNLPGLAGVSIRLSVIEPAQVSAIGNPEEAIADADHLGPEEIYVRTAGIRAVVSLDLPLLSGISGLTNAVLDLAAPITTLLNNVLSLDLESALTGLVGSLVGIPYEVTDIELVAGSSRIDVSIDIGASEAYVSDYECGTSTDKSLTVDGNTSVASIRIGQLDLDESSPDFVFGSTAPAEAAPLPLVDIGVKTCSVFLLVVSTCDDRRAFEGGGLAISVNLDPEDGLLSTPFDDEYLNPPFIGEPPLYKSFTGADLVGSLSGTLESIELETYEPDGNGGLGGLLSFTDSTLNVVNDILNPVIDGLLSPILDPLLNTLLNTLGLSLANTEVGANLTCENDKVRLVN